MGVVKQIRHILGRPLFVLVVVLACVYFASLTPVRAQESQDVIVPKITGIDYSKVTLTNQPESAQGALFQIIVPTSPQTALNDAVKVYIDQQVAAFKAALPNVPANVGFFHQLRIVPRVDYVTKTATSLTLEIDEYHPLQDVTTRYISWQSDQSGVHQGVLTKQAAEQIGEALGIHDKTLKDHINQPFAFGLLPNHDIRIYQSDFFSKFIHTPYKDLDLNSVHVIANQYHKAFYGSYDVVLPPVAKVGLKMQYARALAKETNQPIDCSLQSCLAITFDDGPDSGITPKVLDVLKDKNIKATFFELGIQVQKHPEVTKRALAEGNEVENHSFAHPDFVKLKVPAAMRKEIDTTQAALAAVGTTPKFFRPPYGSANAVVRSTVNMPLIFWNVDAQEWRAGNDAGSVARSILAQARPGAIMLMHDTKPLTPDALPLIITNLKDRGYKFVTVQNLLQIDANARGDFWDKQ